MNCPSRGYRPLPDHTATCPLGGVIQANRLHKRNEAPWPGMRVYGRYALVYVIEGEGRYADAIGREAVVTAGDLIIVLPDLPHRYHAQPCWTEHYVVFDGPVFRLWEQSGLLDRQRVIHRLEPVRRWHERLLDIVGCDPLSEVMRLQQVLVDIAMSKRNTQEGWSERVRRAIEDDPSQQFDLEALAHELGMSFAHFRRRFSQTFGMSPGRYLAAKVIDRACAMMASTDLPDKRIAAVLGFTDPFHFSRRFKQIAGRTPSAFREVLARQRDANARSI